MFKKKIWIPIVLVLIGVAIGATFWGRHIASQEPIKIYTTETLDENEKNAKSTSEHGHYHADGTWHADTHAAPLAAEPTPPVTENSDVWYPENYTQADIEADLAGTPAMSDAEYRRRATKTLVNVYLQTHQRKYPDCKEHAAVLADAISLSDETIDRIEHRKKQNALDQLELQLEAETDQLLRGGVVAFTAHLSTLSTEEQRKLKEKIEALQARIADLGKRQRALDSECPGFAKLHHTHEGETE